MRGEVHYYGAESSLLQSVFPEVSELTPWPYGGFYLEAMDSHGGWIASAIDLARFSYALESTNPNALLEPETLTQMIAQPDIPLWEDAFNYYALGWFVRLKGSDNHRWHSGSLPGTTAVLYRMSNGLTWAASFNTRSDPPGGAFLVDLITAMGLAAIMNKVIWGSLIILIVLIGAISICFIRQQKRRGYDCKEADHL